MRWTFSLISYYHSVLNFLLSILPNFLYKSFSVQKSGNFRRTKEYFISLYEGSSFWAKSEDNFILYKVCVCQDIAFLNRKLSSSLLSLLPCRNVNNRKLLDRKSHNPVFNVRVISFSCVKRVCCNNWIAELKD